MHTLFFDTFAGISGDMTVGALLALGVPHDALRAELAKLPLGAYELVVEERFVNGIGAVKFDVRIAAEGAPKQHSHSHHGHRSHAVIREMIQAAHLSPRVEEISLAVFRRLAEAEGEVHGVDPDAVHFHEVGAVDSIVDIVGAAFGLAHLGVQRCLVGAIPVGSGIVRSQHGPIPVPAPATMQLLRGFAVRQGDGAGELVTPTGAAILAALAEPKPPVGFQVERVGYGAGTRVLEDRPNLLRLVLGRETTPIGADELVLLEANVDDGSPEMIAYVMERLFAAGAKDVFLTPIVMKKGRAATKLSVLCVPTDREAMAAIVLAETTSIGIRSTTCTRTVLRRTIVTVATEYGDVRVKVANAPGGFDNLSPEYEDCRRLAGERSVPFKVVYQAALAAARS